MSQLVLHSPQTCHSTTVELFWTLPRQYNMREFYFFPKLSQFGYTVAHCECMQRRLNPNTLHQQSVNHHKKNCTFISFFFGFSGDLFKNVLLAYFGLRFSRFLHRTWRLESKIQLVIRRPPVTSE